MTDELHKEIDAPIGPQALLPLRGFVLRCFEEAGLAAKDRRALAAALDEALTGIVLGGKEDGRAGTIHVTLDINPTRVRLLVCDNTEGAELGENPEDGLMHQAVRRRRELGFSLIRRVMDEVRYTYRRGFQNELEMIKFVFERETAVEETQESAGDGR